QDLERAAQRADVAAVDVRQVTPEGGHLIGAQPIAGVVERNRLLRAEPATGAAGQQQQKLTSPCAQSRPRPAPSPRARRPPPAPPARPARSPAGPPARPAARRTAPTRG